MNGGFGTGVELSESGVNGPCVYPVSCLGLRVRVRPAANSYVQFAVLDGVAGDPDHPGGTHVKLGHGDGALLLGEIGYSRPAGDTDRFLHVALGGWHYTAMFDDVLDTGPDGTPLRRRGSQGIYALVEGELSRESGAGQGLSGFLRVGLANEDVNPIRYSLAAGLAYTGLVPGRDGDVTGLGIAVGGNGGKYRLAQENLQSPVDKREVVFELTYHLQPAPWLAVQFDAQYIVNPSMNPSVEDALLVGLRYGITF